MNSLRLAVADGVTIAKRNALKIRRAPDLLGGVVMLPTVFVLLFTYVFGSMIDLPGISYAEYLLPGIFVLTIVSSAQITGYTLTQDLQKGVFDRFRTLPMSPSAVLTGQTFSDVIMNVTSIVTMALVGLAVGWRVHGSPFEAALGFLMLLLFAYAFSWVTATVALALRTPEVFNNVATIMTFPLVFLSNAFVDSARLPGPLKPVAEWNPVSTLVQAARDLFGNTSPALPVPGAWPLRHAVPVSLMWSVLLLVVFVPLATRLYKRAVSR
ncbi:transport permease protein [Sphaerisporangium krabiense]|uniref:Transport permease protein n=1 Tax=Sphaerisporangium krabiense TaxID=763782 RepID=A0A7W9DQ26_9ACTN|nr:ABC transporter permease [Sphaerisporangium krabiense]MBB5625960.1 ABC transporter DrrB family efflux protein [Sphaerisporangium krabiense]GII64762.1 transport permease protein [Sphaerisporangium krabiense]